MDVYCLCEKNFHLDGFFAYAIQCPHCGRRYEMDTRIQMRLMPPDEIWDGCDIKEGSA